MAIRVTVLILLLWLSLRGIATAAASSSCLKCHPSHHAGLDRCTGCHSGDDRATRKQITHLNLVPGRLVQYRIPGNPAVEPGRQWIEKSGCRRCHTINAKGNKLASNLDRLTGRHPLDLLASILKPVASMPDFRFDEETAGQLVNAILVAAKPDRSDSRKVPVVVRFNRKGDQQENTFEKRCGGCHQVLTKDWGGIGKGVAGPNLSGLLTGFYPTTYGKSQRWTDDRLRQWIANPRDSRPNARMQPVPVKREELTELYKYFRTQTD